ncbi:MAG: CBS domain-containing protein [Desulfomonilia bacterium]|jgi:acetoin utilization protein AcuB|uniref:Inosine-5'-monophosphate dehydrogenase n=1 Tax=anaerobic digester metagenome TaxID=1263854 RepID=A0A485M2Q8_9ZZZZ|nr:CBS domain-containing protein [Pseudomonadota bacterium]HON39312.1 CBS domain-containing protein [Deltaproteobacteria bacterium]HRS57280.1 CBS domain-containing protein [Desulfomonilia bacterium]HPD20247.1 CBS domain-containing protein [Deltaproteobacteria bacterium]HPX17632.1 CBS domain-containing protein [Deltaproteobacteria bacterium]
MNVESWMVTDLITIGKEAGIRDALAVMKKFSVRHLPVVEGGLFIGLVTSGDLKQAVLASMLETLKVGDVMIQNPVTITRDTSLEKAARIIYEKNIGCLPVVEDKRIVGIITIKDILKAFIEIMGVLRSGSRLDVILKSVHGSFDEVVSIIESKGGSIISAGMTIDGDENIHHFRISGGDTAAIAEELIQLGYRGVKVVD